ncbi:type I restriction-modification system subunit M [Holzapfeliella sp. JNUCC 72]
MTEEHQNVQSQQQAELQKHLWAIANDLRGNMDASEFRNYILGLIFYRFLSDRVEDEVTMLLDGEDITYEQAYNNPDYEGLAEDIVQDLGFTIKPRYLFSSLIKDCQTGEFDIEKLQNAINSIQSSTIGEDSQEDFQGLFDDMDLQSPRIGNNVAERSELMRKVLLNLNNISFRSSEIEIDVLGDAYEYLIGQFAASAGKKAGEFYTPQQVSKIISGVVTAGKDEIKSIYDPTMGSGSLLLTVGDRARIGHYYGQEWNSTTYNLARMNLLMHGINYSNFSVKQGDTLENDRFPDEKFDAVVANPPYSANWNNVDKLTDERFRKYGKVAPKSKADLAFVTHMLYHLNDNGTMAVVLPHGVLFRGAAEGVIRKYMIEQDNVLDAVIGLPANLFFGTSIPTTILVFKKNRPQTDILFIDASKEFEKGKNQNSLTQAHIDKILQTYEAREDVDKYAHVASLDEIKENDFNLNIPRYVDTFEPEPEIDINQVKADIEEVNQQIAKIEAELAEMEAQLVETDVDE